MQALTFFFLDTVGQRSSSWARVLVRPNGWEPVGSAPAGRTGLSHRVVDERANPGRPGDAKLQGLSAPGGSQLPSHERGARCAPSWAIRRSWIVGGGSRSTKRCARSGTPTIGTSGTPTQDEGPRSQVEADRGVLPAGEVPRRAHGHDAAGERRGRRPRQHGHVRSDRGDRPLRPRRAASSSRPTARRASAARSSTVCARTTGCRGWSACARTSSTGRCAVSTASSVASRRIPRWPTRSTCPWTSTRSSAREANPTSMLSLTDDAARRRRRGRRPHGRPGRETPAPRTRDFAQQHTHGEGRALPLAEREGAHRHRALLLRGPLDARDRRHAASSPRAASARSTAR